MGHSKTIVLVVEDETLVRVAIADHLEDAGFTVLEAENAEKAIAILVRNPDVKLVFTDVDMPGGMDGLRLAAAIRDRWPPIKIVVTSGYRLVPTDELPVEAEFFSKPYNPDKIVSSFQAMMRRQ